MVSPGRTSTAPAYARRASTAVVILNYRHPADTLGCVASLELSDDLDFEIIVVDNAPDGPAHRELCDALGRRATTIASGGNLGYAGGNNIAIARALELDVDFVWLLNPDTTVDRATLATLKRHLVRVPDCAVVGPRILTPGPVARIWSDGGTVDRATAQTGHLNSGSRRLDAATAARDVDYVTGSSMLIRRAALERLGPLPEQYFLYYEETDWCLRAARAGWRVMVEPAVTVVHHKRSSGDLPEPYYLYYMTRNRYLFARDCLGVDGEVALTELKAKFLDGWRARVAKLAPDWLPDFDRLIETAVADARAGVEGRRDEVTDILGPRPGGAR